jgi:hypothetical protein
MNNNNTAVSLLNTAVSLVLCKSAYPEKCSTIEYDLVTNSIASYPTLTYIIKKIKFKLKEL